MADLEALQAFAGADFNLTAPLDADQVRTLVRHWLPEMRFFEEEHFYPVSLQEYTDQVETVFRRLEEQAKDAFRLRFLVRSGDDAITETFDPPVLLKPDQALVTTPDGIKLVGASKILNSGPLGAALEGPDVDADTVLTHGTSFEASDEFFGPLRTLSGAAVGVPGDPYEPRLTPITVIARFINLLEALRFELLAQDDEDHPPDGLVGGLDIAPSLFQISDEGGEFPADSRGPVLDMIQAQLANDPAAFSEALRDLPFGVRFNERAWDALARFAFVEYSFLYPLNDFNRYDVLGNEHEGDDEGCCLVFDRSELSAAIDGESEEALLSVTPHSIVTSVHEEYQGADMHQFLPPGTAREDLDLVIWIAGGSHATYLSPGTRDLLDVGDLAKRFEDWLPLLVAANPFLLSVLATIALLLDLFSDVEDRSSDDGVYTGPEDLVGEASTFIPTRIQMLDMSNDRHTYQPAQRDLLARRAYAGKLGGHDGFVNYSPPFATKTGRYFRRLLRALD